MGSDIRINTLSCLILVLCFDLCCAQLLSGDGGFGGGNGGGGGFGGDDDDGTLLAAKAPPKGLDACNGVFLSYSFLSREKEYPKLKNVTAQAWAFKSMATIINTGAQEVQGWQMYIGFRHREILVSVDGAMIVDGTDFPAPVGNGTTFAGTAMPDLKTSIDTAGDFLQIAQQIKIKGTMFGVKKGGNVMPKTIKLVNDGYKCPAAKLKGTTYMQVCCRKDPKAKGTAKTPKKIKYARRRNGDLSITYDVLQAYGNNYMAQVTIDNNSPLGRLDRWNLTWEWQNNEFINSMKGAFTRTRDVAACVYGKAGKYYGDFDFSTVVTCDKNPVITDLPPDKTNDTKVGKLPYCCKNGTILPAIMDENKARSIFQMNVFKLPPHMTNRTDILPPLKWNIDGVINPNYKCGPPIRVEPTHFPDPTGLNSETTSIASWQVVCNITKPKAKKARCCVSYSAYYDESVIPCNTCACGCESKEYCSKTAKSMLLPQEALLVPFANRTKMALAWAHMNKYHIPNPRPCPDNCPVSIHWHLNSDYSSGFTARVTLFNWIDTNFEDWFAAIQMDKAFPGFQMAYSFNSTKLKTPENTIFIQGLKGLNFLVAETNGSRPSSPRVPGKQQSTLLFKKRRTPGIRVPKGDGFPSKVIFNGEECALPTRLPSKGAGHIIQANLITVILMAAVTFILTTNFNLSY